MRASALGIAAAAFVAGAVVSASVPCTDASASPPPAAAAKKPKKVPALRITKIKPKHGAKFVDLAANLEVTFNLPVDLATFGSETLLLRKLLSTTPLTFTIAQGRTPKQVIVVPDQPFDPGSDYEFIVRTGVATALGGHLKAEKRVLFFSDPKFGGLGLIRPDQFEYLDARMAEPRAAHTATKVAFGRVLLAGGMTDQNNLAYGAELYDPVEKEFYVAASLLRERRAYHQTVEMGAGSALLVGGWSGSDALATCEFYDRTIGDIVPAPTMSERRDFHTATVLPDGRVLVVGGLSYASDGAVYSDTAAILERNFTWRDTADPPRRRRAGHTATLLADGKVLITGGTSSSGATSPSAEIYDPVHDTFTTLSSAPGGHRQLGTGVAIDGGENVLTADGGYAIVEFYEGKTGIFRQAGGSSFVRRSRSTATLLPWGDVLLLGGFDAKPGETTILASMDLYVRTGGPYGKVFYVDVLLREPRAGHTATALDDGTVLIAGGFTNDVSLDSAVVFKPERPSSLK